MAPNGKQQTWMRYLLVGYNKRGCFIYNTKEKPANPPKEATRISLNSQSERTLIFGNSFTKEVNIRNPMRLQEEPDVAAMHRPIGDNGRFTGDLDDLGQALQDGTL